MPSIEYQPLEVRKAYAVSELTKIVNESKTLEEAKTNCRQRLIELVNQGIVRADQVDAEEIEGKVKKVMLEKFEADQKLYRLLVTANSLVVEKKYRLAIDAFAKIIESYPSSGHAYFGLAKSFRGRSESALVAIGQAIKLQPGNQEFETLQSEIQERIEARLNLIVSFDVNRNPHSPSWNNAQGLNYLVLERYAEALKYFKQALNLASEPKDRARECCNIGLCLEGLDKSGEALKMFEKAVSLDPANVYYESTKREFLSLLKE